jgi:CheY-like chemotaxis protein
MKKHILIVEDDMIAAKIASVLFETANCEVDIALSGEIAIDLYAQSLINQKEYYGIYMDIGLPGKTGIETCKDIKKYEKAKLMHPIPIIAVTANKDEKTKAECLAAGMLEVFVKPFTQENIICFLEKCCAD